jgi:hypothetical protein
MSDEKLRILEMIKDGTLTPQEGLDLLQALEAAKNSMQMVGPIVPVTQTDSAGQKEDEEPCCSAPGRKPKWLHIKVDDTESGKNVNIKLPIALAKSAVKFIPKDAKAHMQAHGMDVDLHGLLESLSNEGQMNLVEVSDGDKKVVKIYTE